MLNHVQELEQAAEKAIADATLNGNILNSLGLRKAIKDLVGVR